MFEGCVSAVGAVCERPGPQDAVPTAVCGTCVSGLRPQPQPECWSPCGAVSAGEAPAALAESPSRYLWVSGNELSWFCPPHTPGEEGFRKAVGWVAGVAVGHLFFTFYACMFI